RLLRKVPRAGALAGPRGGDGALYSPVGRRPHERLRFLAAQDDRRCRRWERDASMIRVSGEGTRVFSGVGTNVELAAIASLVERIPPRVQEGVGAGVGVASRQVFWSHTAPGGQSSWLLHARGSLGKQSRNLKSHS